MVTRSNSNSSIRFYCCFLAQLFLLFLQLVVVGQSSSTGSARISGKVVFASNGKPASVVGIELLPEKGLGRQDTITDEQGTFSFTNLTAGTYKLRVWSPGFILDDSSEAAGQIILDKAEERSGIVLRLIKGGVITGRLVDEDEEPVSAVNVSVIPVISGQDDKRINMLPLGTYTDDRGTYRIFGIPPGRYQIAANASKSYFSRHTRSLIVTYYPTTAFRSQATEIEVGAGQLIEGLDFKLLNRKGFTVAGRVTRKDGSIPLADTLVSIKEKDGKLSSRSMGTDGQGRFTFDGLPAGEYEVYAEPRREKDLLNEFKTIAIDGTDLLNVDFELITGATISGIIKMSDGKRPEKIQDSRMYILHNEAHYRGLYPYTQWPRRINSDNSFIIGGVPGAEVQLVIQPSNPDYYVFSILRGEEKLSTAKLDVPAGEHISNIIIVLSDGAASLEGVVKNKDSQKVASGVGVTLLPVDDNKREAALYNYSTQSDSAGKYKVTGIAPGKYYVIVGEQPPLAREDVLITVRLNTSSAIEQYLEEHKEKAIPVEFKRGEKKVVDLFSPSGQD